jgi:hypothetical protein
MVAAAAVGVTAAVAALPDAVKFRINVSVCCDYFLSRTLPSYINISNN